MPMAYGFTSYLTKSTRISYLKYKKLGVLRLKNRSEGGSSEWDALYHITP